MRILERRSGQASLSRHGENGVLFPLAENTRLLEGSNFARPQVHQMARNPEISEAVSIATRRAEFNLVNVNIQNATYFRVLLPQAINEREKPLRIRYAKATSPFLVEESHLPLPRVDGLRILVYIH